MSGRRIGTVERCMGIARTRRRHGRGLFYSADFTGCKKCCFVILSEAMNLSSISACEKTQERFFASLRMTSFYFFEVSSVLGVSSLNLDVTLSPRSNGNSQAEVCSTFTRPAALPLPSLQFRRQFR